MQPGVNRFILILRQSFRQSFSCRVSSTLCEYSKIMDKKETFRDKRRKIFTLNSFTILTSVLLLPSSVSSSCWVPFQVFYCHEISQCSPFSQCSSYLSTCLPMQLRECYDYNYFIMSIYWKISARFFCWRGEWYHII